METSGPRSDGALEHPDTVVTHFFALPDAIGMPAGLSMRFTYDERRQPYLSALGRSSDDTVDLLLREGRGGQDVALKLWQVPVPALGEWSARTAAVRVAETVTGERSTIGAVELHDARSSETGGARTIVTVAETTTWASAAFLDDEAPVDLELEDLTDPLLRSVHAVQHFVRAYRIGTHTPILEPTYMRLSPVVYRARRDLKSDCPPTFDSVVSLSHDNLRERPPKVADPRRIEQWLSSVQLLAAGDPAALVEERLLEAERLATKEGNFSAAVVEAGLAAEILLDGVLGLLYWERYGGAPGSEGDIEAAAKALGKPLATRVRSEYHPLLGGRWDTNAEGPIRDWDQAVARVRGRVVHRGYRARGDEAAEALNAVQRLAAYVRDRIADKCRDFPRTALMVVTKDGLIVRDQWKVLQAFAGDSATREPPWRDNYYAWRNRVDQAVVRRS